MADIQPFSGLRPAAGLAGKIASLPYDVMDSEEARELAKDNPLSFLHVTKSEVDFPPGTKADSPQIYARAAENLDRFIREKILLPDPAPCFYIYRQQMGEHVQAGVAATASVAEYRSGIIKKHELTRPDKEQDRVNHITATEAQTGPVFLTYRAQDEVDALITRYMAEHSPAYDFTADDGIRHTLYVVAGEDWIASVADAFGRIPVLYIADGHHRCAAAARVQESAQAANPHHTGQEAYNRFLAVIFPHNQMQIMDYNRVVQAANGLTGTAFLKKLEQRFSVRPVGKQAVKPRAPHEFGLYLEGGWYELTALEAACQSVDPVRRLDVSILQNEVLEPIFGIHDPRTDKRIQFVGGIRGMQELMRLVDSGQYFAAFSLYPTDILELMEIADAGKIMPPKSTWFEPKLRDAMVIHQTPLPQAARCLMNKTAE